MNNIPNPRVEAEEHYYNVSEGLLPHCSFLLESTLHCSCSALRFKAEERSFAIGASAACMWPFSSLPLALPRLRVRRALLR